MQRSGDSLSMTDAIMRGFARAFRDALAAHDPNLIAPWLDDEIDWLVFGPVDLFPFFGTRRGKAAVLAMVSAIDANLSFTGFDRSCTLADGDRFAVMLRFTAVHKRSGRTMSLRMAVFAEVRAGKLARLRALFDSFDAAEQALGRELDLGAAA
jgi:ketosteroid isomerase-like protein